MMNLNKPVEELKKGTLLCPCHKEPLHFEVWGMMRVVSDDGFYSAYCPKSRLYYKVKAKKQPA